MITADQLKDVMDRADALHHYLNIDQKKVEFEEEQLRTQAPDFWEDPKYAQEQMKKVKGIQKWLDGYKTVRLYADELQLAFDFYKDDWYQERDHDHRGRRVRLWLSEERERCAPTGACFSFQCPGQANDQFCQCLRNSAGR
ncbi:peptide chain release factor 2 [Segatella copri]|nr:peptide chain release factor 2 [Segatella copri]